MSNGGFCCLSFHIQILFSGAAITYIHTHSCINEPLKQIQVIWFDFILVVRCSWTTLKLYIATSRSIVRVNLAHNHKEVKLIYGYLYMDKRESLHGLRAARTIDLLTRTGYRWEEKGPFGECLQIGESTVNV